MKKILVLFGIILSIGLSAQVPGSPDASGTITPGPPDWVTGIPSGGGEMAAQLAYIYSLINPDFTATTVTTTGDITTGTMIRQATTWHIFGGFADSAVVIDLTQGQYSHITNASNNLWGGIESDGIVASGDTSTMLYAGDYFGSFSTTFTGANGVVFIFEVWNVTNGSRQSFPVAATGDGDTDYVTVTKPLYFSGINAGDKLILRATNQDNDTDLTIRFGAYFITYLHD